MAHLERWLVGLQLLVGPVRLVEERVDVEHGLLAVLLVLDGVDGAAGAAVQRVVELGVLAVAARVAQERVLLVVVDGATFVALENRFCCNNVTRDICVRDIYYLLILMQKL